MDLSVTLKGQTHDLKLKNPVLTASGTFGYGVEFAPYGDLAALGGIVVKGLSLKPREGNPCPRIVETTAGMLNAVGLQNDGVEVFCRDKLPHLPWRETPIIANMYATSPAEFGELAARLDGEEGVAALEVNVSCPNVKEGGVLFGQDPKLAAAVTAAGRAAASGATTGGRRYRGHSTGIGVIGLGNIQGKGFVGAAIAEVLVGHLSADRVHCQGSVSVFGSTIQVSDPAYIKVSGQDAGV